MKNDRAYLLHIQECIGRIEEDVRDGRTAFESSHMIQDAVTRRHLDELVALVGLRK